MGELDELGNAVRDRDAAPFAPSTVVVGGGRPPLWIWVVLGCLVVMGVVGAVARSMPGQSPKVRNVSVGSDGQGQFYIIDSDVLAGAYASNEVRADSQFKDRAVRVSGNVKRISKSAFGGAVVSMEPGKVNCWFEKGQEHGLLNLSVGSQVTIQGACGGLSFGDVQINGCRVVSP